VAVTTSAICNKEAKFITAVPLCFFFGVYRKKILSYSVSCIHLQKYHLCNVSRNQKNTNSFLPLSQLPHRYEGIGSRAIALPDNIGTAL
jgi:hypothetical protein